MFYKYKIFIFEDTKKYLTMAIKEVRFIRSITQTDEMNFPKFGKKDITQDFVKRYYNTFAVLAGLNPCSRDLMEYLVEIMNDDNVVMSNEYTRDNFLAELKTITMQPDNTYVEYSGSNIKKAYQSLTERGCLIKIKRGIYKVNPEIYFKKSETSRMESIKVILEFQGGVRNNKMELVCNINEE